MPTPNSQARVPKPNAENHMRAAGVFAGSLASALWLKRRKDACYKETTGLHSFGPPLGLMPESPLERSAW